MGDAILLSRYKLLKSNNWNWSVGVGLKLPLGSTKEKSNLGIVLNVDLQPGSNALDDIYITSISK